MILSSIVCSITSLYFIVFLCPVSLYASFDEKEDSSNGKVIFHTAVGSQETNSSPVKRRGVIKNSPLREGAWNTVPSELWRMIFDELSFSDFGNVRQVCKHWHALAHHEMFSLRSQILRHRLSTLLEKANFREDIFSKLRISIAKLAGDSATSEAFFNSPQALQKVLFNPNTIAFMH